MSTTTLMNVEQFAQLPDDERGKYELVEGELVPVSSPTPRHNIIRQKIAFLLQKLLQKGGLGGFLVETDVRLDERTVRRPDVVCLTETKWQAIDRLRIPVSITPDLAIEVLSQADAIMDFNHKVNEYLRAGIAEVWLVYPEDREVHVRRGKAVQVLQAGDTLESPVLLPGFSVKIAEIFEEL